MICNAALLTRISILGPKASSVFETMVVALVGDAKSARIPMPEEPLSNFEISDIRSETFESDDADVYVIATWMK